MPTKKKPVEPTFTYTDNPVPVRHVIIEAVIEDADSDDLIDNALDCLQMGGMAEIRTNRVIGESLDQAHKILRARIAHFR
jgi:hypothetical protein